MHCMGQNIKSLAVCVCVSFCVCSRRHGGFGSNISKTLRQWTTTSKWPMGNRLVTWSVNRDLGMFGREIASLEKKSRHWTDSVFVQTLSCLTNNISRPNAICMKFDALAEHLWPISLLIKLRGQGRSSRSKAPCCAAIHHEMVPQ